MSQIRVSEDQKKELVDMRLHPKETYEDTIKRLLGWWNTCEGENCHRMGPMDDKMKETIKKSLEKKFGLKCTKIEDVHDGIDFHFEGKIKGTPVWIPKR